MTKIEKYIFGNENKPEWFTKACENGKIKILVDDDGIKTAKVVSGTSNYVAKEGDIIIKTINGLVVKNKLEKENKNVEEKVDDIS